MTRLEAAIELGMKKTDFNGARQVGVNRFQRTVGLDGKRLSTATAFLEPAKREGRKNLDILSEAEVTQIRFKGKKAAGVQFLYKGNTFKLNLKNHGEVIVSAGTINSAKLLMLSGIGPKEDLLRLKIPVVADLPVGQNFQDRPAFLLVLAGSIYLCSRPLKQKSANNGHWQ